ncbi:MAG: exodeoxyribonuclease VII small subunit [Pseudomonadota bacterium]
MADKKVEAMSFEEAIAELEQVVNRLDSGDVSLEDSIKLYERGAALKTHCETKLKAAEEKVEQITLDASGAPTGTRPAEGM